MKPSLDGVRGKIARSKGHLEHLKRVLSERSSAEAINTLRRDDETHGWCIDTVLKQPTEVPLLAKLLVGDVVHGLACALDHLVYQLSLSHQIQSGIPDASQRCDGHKTHFPIFAVKSPDSERTIKKRLKLMAQAPADFINRMQPYQRAADLGLDALQDPLWILFRLDVIDKHRVVLTTNELVTPTELTISSPGEEPDVIKLPEGGWQPFEDGAKLLTITLGPGEQLKSNVQFHLDCMLQVQFAETGHWCDGKPVVSLLDQMIAYVERFIVGNLALHVI